MPTVEIDRLDPPRTALIVVDMENDFVAEGAPLDTPAAREMVPRLAEALRICYSPGRILRYGVGRLPSPPGLPRVPRVNRRESGRGESRGMV